MQDKNQVIELGYIQHPKDPALIPHPDFAYTWTNAAHGFPVGRLAASLNDLQFVTGLSPGQLREELKGRERISAKSHMLHDSQIESRIYKYMYIMSCLRKVLSVPFSRS
jgi:hypothetical protein